MQTQPKQKEEEPEVDAEQAWANATWGDDSTRRASTDKTMNKATEQPSQQQQQQQQQQQPPQQHVPKQRARRATMSFGIMGELPSQHGIYDTQQTPPQPQTNRRSSLGFGPTNLLRGIRGFRIERAQLRRARAKTAGQGAGRPEPIGHARHAEGPEKFRTSRPCQQDLHERGQRCHRQGVYGGPKESQYVVYRCRQFVLCH